MRPVDKWSAGTVEMADGTTVVIAADFPEYREAKPFLCMNMGTVCSYCEKAYADERDLQVEHIQPTKYQDITGEYIYAHLKTAWSNFLLSCATCNGADNKDTKNVVYGECHLPHLNNTFLSFCYDKGGVVIVNPLLQGQSRDHACALLDLVGLGKGPLESSPGDKRWKVRTEIWNLADRYLAKYLDKKADVETVIDLAKGRGGWSIWFTVFKGCDEIRKALIESFPGTAAGCFDPNNNYEPLPRNPGNLSDPV